MLTTGTGCSDQAGYAGDSFTNFSPAPAAFPGAPVERAEVEFGFLPPIGAFGVCRLFDEWVGRYDQAVDGISSPWRGARYDWLESGQAATWAIGLRTTGFDADLPADVKAIYQDSITSCVDQSVDDVFTTARQVKLEGLPQGTTVVEFTGEVGEDRDRTLHAFAAFVVVGDDRDWVTDTGSAARYYPGDSHPTHLMEVAWIGWNAQVPADEFVDLVDSFLNDATSDGAVAATTESSTAFERAVGQTSGDPA